MTGRYKRYNLVALFPREQSARDAVRLLVSEGVPDEDVFLERRGADTPDRRAAAEAEMQQEVDESVKGVVMLTREQATGAFWGVVAVGAVGALVGLLLALTGGQP